MAELANLGFKVDTSGLQKGEQALDSYARKGEQVEKSTDRNAKAMGEFGRKAGMAGIQIEQLVGSINAGQNPLRAFGFQATDLGFVLGFPLVGAIAGISASMASVLMPALIGSKDAMKELDDIAESLSKTLVNASDGTVLLSEKLEQLARRSKALARLQISASLVDTEKQIKVATRGILEAVDDSYIAKFSKQFQKMGLPVDQLINVLGSLGSQELSELNLPAGDLVKFRYELNLMANTFGISKEQALELGDAAGNMFTDKSVVSIKRFESVLADINDETGGTSKKLVELGGKLIPLTSALFDGVDKTNLLRQAFSDLPDALDKSGEKSVEFSNKIDSINKSIEAQIIALEKGEEAAFRFNLANQFKGGAIPEQTAKLLDSLFKIKKDQEKLTADKKAVDFFEKQKLALAGLNDELQVLNIRQQGLALGLGNNEIDELVRIAEKQQEIKREMESSKELDDLINKVNDFGGAWTNTGNIIVDSFGSMSNALSDYMKRLDGLGALREDLAKMEVKHGASDKRVIEARMNLNEKEFEANIAGFKTVAGAFSQMFKENSKEREAFHKLEVALTAVEIALSFQRALAYAKEAIAGASAAPFPLGFAGFAGMAALMAGLGLFGSGGGGVDVEERQKKQGTGTVLGSDDKTESISKNIQLLADVSIDQLFEIKGLKDATISLSDSIEKLAVTLVRDVDFGFSEGSSSALTDGGKLASKSFAPAIPVLDPLGIIDFNKIFSAIGGVKKTVEDQGILFLSQTVGDIIDNGFVEAVKFVDIRRKEKALGVTISDKIKRTTDDIDDGLARDMGLVFDSIQMTIEESMTALGFNIDGVLDKFQIQEFELSIKGLSGEEIQKEIEAVFGKQADLMAEFIIDLDQFQQVGEGAFETLVRVANEQLRFNNALELMGNSLLGLNMADTQGIIKMFGGLDEFSGATNSFIENFLTSSELMAHQSNAINDVFADLGLTFTSSREGFKNLVTGIDLTTMEGKELFTTLTQLSPAIAEYIDKVEAIERERSDLTIDLLAAQGKEEEALAMKRRLELDAMDDSLKALQLQVWAEQDRAKAIAESESSLGGLIDSIRGVVGVAKTADVLGALQSARVGDFTKALELDINKALNVTGASSAAELALQTAITQNRLLEIAKLAEGQLTEGQQQINILSSIDDGISDLKDTFEMPIRNSDDQKQLMAELMTTMQDLKYAVQSTAKWSSETALNTRKIYIQSEGV